MSFVSCSSLKGRRKRFVANSERGQMMTFVTEWQNLGGAVKVWAGEDWAPAGGSMMEERNQRENKKINTIGFNLIVSPQFVCVI